MRAFNVSLKAFEAYEKATGDALGITSFQVGSQAMSAKAGSLVKDITNWLLNEYGYNDNTTTKGLRHLATVLKWHVSEGLAGSIPVNIHIGKRDPIEARESPALTPEEVQALWEVELPENTNLWHSRNAFILGCYTGQRVSDWKKIDPAKWREAFQLVSQQKTGHSARILHTPEVRAVLKLYAETGWPTCITERSCSVIVNEHTKIACKRAGITRNVPVVVRKHGRDVVEPDKPLCNVVTTHTARRTFVTIQQNSGAAEADIMKRTGHRSIKTMHGYDRTTADQFAKKHGVEVWEEE